MKNICEEVRSSFSVNLQAWRLISGNFIIKWTPSQVFFDRMLFPPPPHASPMYWLKPPHRILKTPPLPYVLNTCGKPCCKELFSKQTCLKGEEICCVDSKEKQLRINGKEMTLTFFKLYMVYIKIRRTLFPYLLVNLFNERCISFTKGYEYWNKLIRSYKNNGLTFLKNAMYVPTIPLML